MWYVLRYGTLGIEALSGYLLHNVNNGIHYHNGKTYCGDYDACETEEQVIELLHNGKGKTGLGKL
ncbi:hypothetical protein Ga0466249_001167 [Sporomusaceae bacterium BoRhaA]|uniref:hypothetical protein n=1 Tax=Pelorhabdus rhamnosifermentans TaxID=2772457 RepID=UPI001C0640D8|nr:hypothetical protein [Pelorhabdus rhamnosifermentans]MBU2700075.1 hypothetical protein [Pelorhabdus rhamnosifermentans]